MRLKSTVFIMIMMASCIGWSRTVDQLSCGKRGANWSAFSIRDVFGDVGTLAFNYSSARVVCPMDFIGRLERTGHLKCHGAWDWDFDRKSGNILDTMAWIVIQAQGGSLYGEFETTQSYGARKIKVDCQIEEIEIKDEEK